MGACPLGADSTAAHVEELDEVWGQGGNGGQQHAVYGAGRAISHSQGKEG